MASPTDYTFAGKSVLVFCGNVNPYKLLPFMDSSKACWLTLGLYNVLIEYSDIESAQPLLAECRSARVSVETWTIENGYIVDSHSYVCDMLDDLQWKQAVGSFVDNVNSADFLEAFRESSSALCFALSKQHLLPIRLGENLTQFGVTLSKAFPSWSSIEDGDKIGFLGAAQNINSALSRFISQTFTGISPIRENSCHFWSHSFLGIGTPIIALHNVLNFLDQSIRDQHIPERVAAYAEYSPVSKDIKTKFPPAYLDKVTYDPSDEEPIPTLGYFSARDGFRRTIHSISVPLASISCGNSKAWSLRSTTHEVSHGVISEIFTHLFPFLSEAECCEGESDSVIDNLLRIRGNESEAKNALDEIRCLIADAALNIEMEKNGEDIEWSKLNADKMRAVLRGSFREMNEILAHAFDFMYFYQGDEKNYIESLWNSWSVIPNVNGRMSEYLCRTICAVFTGHINEESGLLVARAQVGMHFEEMIEDNPGLLHVNKALSLLNQLWPNDANEFYGSYLYQAVIARISLITVMWRYLYSSKVLAGVLGYTPTTGKKGLDYTRHAIGEGKLANPVKFIMQCDLDNKPNSLYSAWFFYYLAFCAGGENE